MNKVQTPPNTGTNGRLKTNGFVCAAHVRRSLQAKGGRLMIEKTTVPFLAIFSTFSAFQNGAFEYHPVWPRSAR